MDDSLEAARLDSLKSFQKEDSRYTYDTLKGPDKIRTIRLHATKDRIECNIQQIGISGGGYQALSYVWGNPEKQFKAFVFDEDDNELGFTPLTMNLQLALCDLRDAEEVKSKVFWIDRICINQEWEEKSGHVALMRNIPLTMNLQGVLEMNHFSL